MSGTVSRQSLRRYALYFLAWTINGLFSFSRDVARRLYWHETSPWRDVFYSWMVGTYLCAAFTPLLLWLGDRWPIERHNWPKRTALHLLFATGYSVAELALEAVVFIQLGIPASLPRSSFWHAYPVLLVVGFHGNIITYLIVLGIQSGARYYRRYQEREQQALRLELRASELQSQLIRAQLSALKMQLQPHFLFNTLNAIMVLVRQHKGPEAEEMLTRLGDLLRCVLEDVETQEVPLERELEYLRLYLAIEQVRFQDRLTIQIVADPETLDAAVPHMGLQPIVENALRHGIGRDSGGPGGRPAGAPGNRRWSGTDANGSRRLPGHRTRQYPGPSPAALRGRGETDSGKRQAGRGGRHHASAVSPCAGNTGNEIVCV